MTDKPDELGAHAPSLTGQLLAAMQMAGWNVQFCGTAFEEADRNYVIEATLGDRKEHVTWNSIRPIDNEIILLASKIGFEEH